MPTDEIASKSKCAFLRSTDYLSNKLTVVSLSTYILLIFEQYFQKVNCPMFGTYFMSVLLYWAGCNQQNRYYSVTKTLLNRNL